MQREGRGRRSSAGSLGGTGIQKTSSAAGASFQRQLLLCPRTVACAVALSGAPVFSGWVCVRSHSDAAQQNPKTKQHKPGPPNERALLLSVLRERGGPLQHREAVPMHLCLCPALHPELLTTQSHKRGSPQKAVEPCEDFGSISSTKQGDVHARASQQKCLEEKLLGLTPPQFKAKGDKYAETW